MAEAGSFADKVKTQADIVRVISDYVRLKKTGQNFTGLCPFHSEKTPSFAVHPVKQIYHCFGCGVGGDVFSFVMAVDKCDFPEAVRSVAEKCGIPIPKPRARTPEEAQANRQRSALVDMHKEAAAFFARQLNDSPEGKIARAYLEDRGLDDAACSRFALGYAPSSGDALLRALKQKFPEKLMDSSGLLSKDASGRLFDRFRRRIMFPIANESGKIIAFGGRALGDDLPKYLNSPESPIYSKSAVLYHLDKAKDEIRKQDFAVLVEGYMDVIGVARAGVANVVASCGTSLTEPQIKLLARFSRRVVVNYDPDLAGQAATERSLNLLLEQQFEVRVLALSGGADPDKFIREHGADAYKKLLAASPSFVDYLIGRARSMDLSSAEGKLKAVNYLMPYVQRVPNRLIRSEWATRIASQLRIEEPVLREAFRKAAAERKGEVKPKPELHRNTRLAEQRLIRVLVESHELRGQYAAVIAKESLHIGRETERIFTALIGACVTGAAPDLPELAKLLPESESRKLYEISFSRLERPEDLSAEAESALDQLRRQRIEDEIADIEQRIGVSPTNEVPSALFARKRELRRVLADLRPFPEAE